MPTITPLEIFLLDMGATKYGDCIVCRRGKRTMLIDGAHPGDDKPGGTMPSIPEQLQEILGNKAPFHFDLLVVTHVHLDHTGCLPAMVKRGLITAQCAVVADPDYGYGRIDGTDALADLGLDRTEHAVVAALREEGALDNLTDQEVRQLIADAAGQEAGYLDMLERLAKNGTKVIRYRGQKLPGVEKQMRELGLKILGPTKAHLELCTRAIGRALRQGADAVRRKHRQDAALDEVRLFRELVRPGGVDYLDAQSRPGYALNDQSILLSVAAGGKRALLTGDMQFTKPEVDGLEPYVQALRRKIAAAGPYNFAKIAHHGSHNAFDETVLDQFGASCLAISGGFDDPGHPDPAVLTLLRARKDRLRWARTDKNGLITAKFTSKQLLLDTTRGEMNDSQRNRKIDEQPETSSSETSAPLVTVRQATTQDQHIEIITRLPNQATRVTLTIEVTPDRPAAVGVASIHPVSGADPSSSALPALNLFGGREIKNLLFVTDRAALARNIGVAETDHLLAALKQKRCEVLDREFSKSVPGAAAELVRAAMQGRSDIAGLVLLGGYDVVPSFRLSVLSAEERTELNRKSRHLDDPDDFVVWCDDAYGDIDGDGLPDLPVSRVPDAKQAAFLFTSLSAEAVPDGPASRFGLRNFNRQFAEKVFASVPGIEPLQASQRITPVELGRLASLPHHVYWMLHGADFDTSRFWGEYENGRTLEACNIANLPKKFQGVSFAGCCYGALIVDGKANTALGQEAPTAIPVNRSLSLSLLAAGANAFVGCTAAHYSPMDGDMNHYGAPLHRAFWKNIAQGLRPAAALHQAKLSYLPEIPHGPQGIVHVAIEKKIAFQFTCLGLGW